MESGRGLVAVVLNLARLNMPIPIFGRSAGEVAGREGRSHNFQLPSKSLPGAFTY
jgi:hypothetical protein